MDMIGSPTGLSFRYLFSCGSVVIITPIVGVQTAEWAPMARDRGDRRAADKRLRTRAASLNKSSSAPPTGPDDVSGNVDNVAHLDR
jgi:hypothetical protein